MYCIDVLTVQYLLLSETALDFLVWMGASLSIRCWSWCCVLPVAQSGERGVERSRLSASGNLSRRHGGHGVRVGKPEPPTQEGPTWVVEGGCYGGTLLLLRDMPRISSRAARSRYGFC